MHAADVGLAVEGATDVARAAADMIMLEPDLGVLADGVEEGRRTYANIMKYLRMGTSSNFGNMLSMAVASLFIPFLPLTPIQMLLNNLLYDLSEVGIPYDSVTRTRSAAARLGHVGTAALHADHGAAVVAVRYGDLRHPAARLPCLGGGVSHRLVRRVDGDADSRHLPDPHGGTGLEQPAAPDAGRSPRSARWPSRCCWR